MSALLTTAELRSGGMSRRAIDAAVRRGALTRVRRGVYARRGLHPDLAAASRMGGSVSCVTALRLHGVWTPDGYGLHVRVHSDARVSTAPGVRRIHHTGLAPRGVAIDPPLRALGIAVHCVGDLDAVVLLDSAVHQKLVTATEVQTLLARTIRGRRLLSRMDARAESGTETMVRVRLRSRGIRVRVQVPIAGIGRIDLLVGDRLVIEVDGEKWHDRESTFESDRVRDAALVTRGYLVLRYSYRRVTQDWTRAEAEILTLVRRRMHVRRSGGNQQPRP